MFENNQQRDKKLFNKKLTCSYFESTMKSKKNISSLSVVKFEKRFSSE